MTIGSAVILRKNVKPICCRQERIRTAATRVRVCLVARSYALLCRIMTNVETGDVWFLLPLSKHSASFLLLQIHKFLLDVCFLCRHGLVVPWLQ